MDKMNSVKNVPFYSRLFNWIKRRLSINKGNEFSNDPTRQSDKCPQCGNDIELLLAAMEFGDPTVYKCAHCKCTIISPGTSFITRSGKLLPSWSRRENIISAKNGEIKFVGKINHTEGRDYTISYPLNSFRASRKFLNAPGMSGDDVETVEYTLKPLITGLFCISEIINLNGKPDECHRHFILVE
ncbi:MAG: hypothetical protein ACI4BC_04100 [Muribaculaceae bacterium]